MKITALIENTTQDNNIKTEHGLSFYVEVGKKKLLIDTGASGLFLENAKTLGVDISKVTALIITHGHYDHGGGLGKFLEVNDTAKVYIQSSAFEPHFVKTFMFRKDVGIDSRFREHPQVVLLDGDFQIGDDITLITDPMSKVLMPKFNEHLFEKKDNKLVKDTFVHEQSVIITEKDKIVLIAGCAHRGILNILRDAEFKMQMPIEICISGFHLYSTATKKTEMEVIDRLADELKTRTAQFYTCHCTGVKAFEALQLRLSDKIQYISAGQTIQI